MTFRDDSDAILARNTALEAENAKLTQQRDGARAALEHAKAQVEVLEEEKRALEARLPKSTRARSEHARWLWFALVGLAIVAGGGVWWTCLRAEPERVERAVKAADPAVPEDTLESITALRQCLDNGDLYLRLFLVAPADARRSDLLGHVRQCVSMVGGEHGPGLMRASTVYVSSLVALQPDVEALFRFFESSAVTHDTDGAGRAALEATFRTRAASWLEASDQLRAAMVAPYDQAKDEGFARAPEHSGQLTYLLFSSSASRFLDVLTTAGATLEQCNAAAGAMRGALPSLGSSGSPRWLELSDLAREICGISPGITASNAPRVLELVSRYNEQGLGRPYPFTVRHEAH